MQRPRSRLNRVLWPAFVLLIGAVFLIVAFVQAGGIPLRAHDDFSALVRAHGGSMSFSPTYPETYRLMAAQSRMLQNAYLGLTGVGLVTVGAIGVVGAGSRERQEA